MGHAIYCMATERLTKPSGEAVILRWQSAQVLRILAEKLGQPVRRDHLFDAVWGDVSVTDDSLTQCIRDIRMALEDHDHALVVTLRKRGYILNGALLTEAEALPAPRPATGAAPECPGPADPARTDSLAGEIRADLDPRDLLPTIAVLPMRHFTSGLPGPLGYFLSGEIAHALCRSDEVNVISQLSMDRIGPLEPAAMKSLVRADFVLAGFFVEDGARLMLSVQLSETERGMVLWSDRMRLQSATMLQDQASIDRIVAQIRTAIMIKEMHRIRSHTVTDLRLFSVLRGAVGLMHQLSRRDFDTARGHLEHVAAAAPRAPAPLAWLARWHLLRSVQGWTDDPAAEARAALAYTSRALDIDPQCTLALVCEGQVLTHMLRKLDDAADRYAMALQTNPNDAQGRALRGMLETFRDNGQLGKRDTERALHLTPLDPHRFFYLVFAAGANLSLGDFARAEVLAKQSLRLNRTHVSTLRTLAAAQVGLDRLDEARQTAARLMQLQPALRVSRWLQTSPSADYANGRRFADLLHLAGVPA